MIKEWIEIYEPQTEEEFLDALREVMQEITLAAFSRTGFYKKAAFYGGTALRIFYGLDRYSEDLDFSLLEPDPDFSLEPYFTAIKEEFAGMGMTVELRESKKKVITPIESAFLKSETTIQELVLEDIVKQAGIRPSNKRVTVKIEIDKDPPLGFQTEEKLLVRPFSFYVKCFSLPDLFAGKMHALLFRKWKNRIKGRDWYDMEWYIRRNTPLSLDHFLQRALNTGDWQKDRISKAEFRQLLQEKIETTQINSAKEDVIRFIKDPQKLDIWSQKYFEDLTEKLKFKE